MDISDTYRPLRNHLRRVSLLESLGVIRAYAQHFQFRRPFPKDIQVHDSLLLAGGTAQRDLQLWELETLTREVILNSPDDASGEKSLRNWDYFAGAINKIKDIDNAIARFYTRANLIHELHRLAHRQFPWQRAPNQRALARYFYIFSNPPLDTILRSVLGLSARELYLAGMAFTGSILDDLVLDNPPSTDIPDLAPDLIARFVTRFSRPLAEIRSKLGAAQKLDENYFYTFNPLVAYPMIGMTVRGRESLVVPLSTYSSADSRTASTTRSSVIRISTTLLGRPSKPSPVK